jgi:hypothetical protein
MVVHLGGGSYKNVSLKGQAEWLTQHRALWETEGGKAASKREQSQTGLNSAEREQANQSATIGKPKTAKRTNSKKDKI